MAVQCLRDSGGSFARYGIFNTADYNYIAWLLCSAYSMVLDDICLHERFCGLDGRLPGLMDNNGNIYADCILSHKKKAIYLRMGAREIEKILK